MAGHICTMLHEFGSVTRPCRPTDRLWHLKILFFFPPYPPRSENLLVIIGPNPLQPLSHLALILTHMLTIPPIAPPIMIRKRRFQPLKRHVSTAHDGLAHVIEAMDHVPVMIFFERVVGRDAAVDGDDGVEAVQLVGHGGCVDGGVGPDDWGGEIIIILRVGDGLEAHSDWWDD